MLNTDYVSLLKPGKLYCLTKDQSFLFYPLEYVYQNNTRAHFVVKRDSILLCTTPITKQIWHNKMRSCTEFYASFIYEEKHLVLVVNDDFHFGHGYWGNIDKFYVQTLLEPVNTNEI